MPIDSRHPYPQLQVWPSSGLTFPWGFYNPTTVSVFDASFGADGVALAETMLINGTDLAVALQQLLGYSWRDTTIGGGLGNTPSVLRRKLPWQHPFTNQMWVKNISSVKGISQAGTAINISPGEGGVGGGYSPNTGPWNTFQMFLLTLHFWRPPYYVRTDSDILDGSGNPQEWLRYVDKNWELSVQMLTREGQSFVWSAGQGANVTAGNSFQGTVGQKIIKFKVMRKWYELPEASLFSKASDSTPSGLPYNFAYCQTATTNPITGYVTTGRSYNGDGTINYPGDPIAGCVNVPVGGGGAGANPPYKTDTDSTKRIFGAPMGTLLFEGVRFITRPLQMPAQLMQIPAFAGSEMVSQVQYDVELHFELFDPPRDSTTVIKEYRGHNLFPFSGDGLWYAANSQNSVGGKKLTAFSYADFADLFKPL